MAAAVRDAGRHVTDVIDRDYFKSIYFREPRHVLFEIATLLPGFAVDEDPDHLGEALRLPAQHEHLRARLEQVLIPIENPRARPPSAAMSEPVYRERPQPASQTVCWSSTTVVGPTSRTCWALGSCSIVNTGCMW